MKHSRIDARGKALSRHVERAIRAERVPVVKELRKQTQRVLRAVEQVEGAVDAIAAELLRKRGPGRPKKQIDPQVQ